MELRALAYFVAVAEERHFTRAATRMHVSQSGLSASIRSLETELHASLFDRTTRRVQLTEAGAALLPDARRALAATRAGTDAVRAVQGLQHGTVSLGIVQQMNLVGLPRILADYHRAHPGIELRLRQAASEELHDLLGAGEIHLAVASPPEPADERIVAVDLLRTPLVVACHPDDPFADRSAVPLRDLIGRNLIGFPHGWALRTLADRALRDAGVSQELNLEVNDTATLLDLVEADLGIALVAQELTTGRRRLRTIPLSTPKHVWTISALAPAPEPRNHAARELWRRITRSAPRARASRPPMPPRQGRLSAT